jgi:hypothetical protein
MVLSLSPSALLLTASLAASSVGAYRAGAQDAEFDAMECRTALKAALAQNKVWQDRYHAETAANNAMAVKVGILSAEASAAREEALQLRQRAEVTGVPATTAVLESRLLDAINDLRLTRAGQAAAQDRLHQLVECAQAMLQPGAAEIPAVRAALESALVAAMAPSDVHSADEAFTATSRIESSRIVSIKPEQRLLLINAGQRAGLKPGTPLRIYRNDRPLASAVVVEVRNSLSGSVVTALEGEEFPQVGDTLRLLSESN